MTTLQTQLTLLGLVLAVIALTAVRLYRSPRRPS